MADKEPRQPTHRAYSVIRREGQDDYWLMNGTAVLSKGTFPNPGASWVVGGTGDFGFAN
jgi:hypothetical protein